MVLALLYSDCVNSGKSLCNLLMRFILHFDFMLLRVGAKSQYEDLGVEHSGSSSHLSARIVWRINDGNKQCDIKKSSR